MTPDDLPPPIPMVPRMRAEEAADLVTAELGNRTLGEIGEQGFADAVYEQVPYSQWVAMTRAEQRKFIAAAYSHVYDSDIDGPHSRPFQLSGAAIDDPGTPDPDELLCRRCDVFVGFGGAGVVKPPEGKTADWLNEHCWMCERSADEIRAAIAAGGK